MGNCSRSLCAREEKYLWFDAAAIVRGDATAAAPLGWRLGGFWGMSESELVTDCGTAPMLVRGLV